MRRSVFALAAVAALLPVVALAVIVLGDRAATSADGRFVGSRPPARIELPSFTLPDHTGAAVRSSDLRGRVVVLTFLDSQCTEACPILSSVIARTIDELEPGERRQVAAIAISTDPAEDTRSSVDRFLRRTRAAGRLRYLVGTEQQLRPLWKRFQILSSLETGEDTLHSAPARIYSRDGVWLATQHAGVDLSVDALVHDIRIALEADG